MTQTQRIIKYCAIGLAVIIILSIVGAAFQILDAISNESVGEMKELAEAQSVSELDIEISAASLEIKAGETLSVSSDSKYVKASIKGGLLKIEEDDNFSWFGIRDTDAGKVILTLPEGIKLDKVSLTAGAGKINISALKAVAVDFEFGAGEVNVMDSSFSSLDLDMGAGKLSMAAELGSGSKIDCGVGRVDITLIGAKEDYKLKISKGLGSIDVQGLAENDGIYGTGAKYIEIDGGVGAINIDFKP